MVDVYRLHHHHNILEGQITVPIIAICEVTQSFFQFLNLAFNLFSFSFNQGMLSLKFKCLVFELSISFSANPFHFIFAKFFDVADAFEDVSDVVDAAFLYV